LGFEFLRHIHRTRVLIHLIDGASQDPLADFSQVNAELALFDPALARKPQIVAVNKMDLPQVREAWPSLERTFEERGYEVTPVSALAREGLRPLLWSAYHALQQADVEVESEEEMPVYRPPEDPDAFTLSRDPDGAWRVRGESIERAAAMTYWEYDEAVRRFQRILGELGIEEALRSQGIEPGEAVRIGEYELEWQE
jgi:GTP-binding protein